MQAMDQPTPSRQIIVTEIDDDGDEIVLATVSNVGNGTQKWYCKDRSGTIAMSGFDRDCVDAPSCVKDDIDAHSISAYAQQISPFLLAARQHGISAVVVMISEDPFDNTEEKLMIHSGVGPTLLAGIAKYIDHCADGMMSFIHVPISFGGDEDAPA